MQIIEIILEIKVKFK